MRYVAIALVSCAMAFGQSDPNHFRLPERLGTPNPWVFSGPIDGLQPFPATVQPMTRTLRKPTLCAIPLLNTLPAYGNTDYKIHVLKPSAVIDPKATPHIGIPACK